MKYVVTEVNEKFAVVLDQSGGFKKINKKGLFVGQKIVISNKINYSAYIAALFLIIFTASFCYAYYTPTQYVFVDINPSFELSLNVFNRIIDSKPLNDDAKKLTYSLNIKNKKIEDSIDTIISTAQNNGYLNIDEGKADILITVSKDDKNQKSNQIIEKINQKSYKNNTKITNGIKESTNINSENNKAVNIILDTANDKEILDAKKSGVSPGKEKLVTEAKKILPKASKEELIKKSVYEIIREFKKEQIKQKLKIENDALKKNDDLESNKTKETKQNEVKENAPSNNTAKPYIKQKENEVLKDNENTLKNKQIPNEKIPYYNNDKKQIPNEKAPYYNKDKKENFDKLSPQQKQRVLDYLRKREIRKNEN